MVRLRKRDLKKTEPAVVYRDRIIEKPGPIVQVPGETKVVEVERVVEVVKDLGEVKSIVSNALAKSRKSKAYRFTISRDINQRIAEVVATPIED